MPLQLLFSGNSPPTVCCAAKVPTSPITTRKTKRVCATNASTRRGGFPQQNGVMKSQVHTQMLAPKWLRSSSNGSFPERKENRMRRSETRINNRWIPSRVTTAGEDFSKRRDKTCSLSRSCNNRPASISSPSSTRPVREAPSTSSTVVVSSDIARAWIAAAKKQDSGLNGPTGLTKTEHAAEHQRQRTAVRGPSASRPHQHHDRHLQQQPVKSSSVWHSNHRKGRHTIRRGRTMKAEKFHDEPSSEEPNEADIIAAAEPNEADVIAAEAALWKTAVDPKSGRTYYYHAVTRETQWRKPLCLASAQERREAAAKERQQREFFRAMEANILLNISAGAYNVNKAEEKEKGGETPTEDVEEEENEVVDETVSLSSSSSSEDGQPKQPLVRPRGLVRTISSMEDSVLQNLVQRLPSHRSLLSQSSFKQNSFSPNDVLSVGMGSVWGPSGSYQSSSVRRTLSSDLVSIEETHGLTGEGMEVSALSLLPEIPRTVRFAREDSMDPASMRPGAMREDSMNLSALYGGSLSRENLGGRPGTKREDSAYSMDMSELVGSHESRILDSGHDGTQFDTDKLFTEESSRMFNESVQSFGLSEKESQALDKLAGIAERMAHVEEELTEEDLILSSDDDNGLSSDDALAEDLGGLLVLSRVEESDEEGHCVDDEELTEPSERFENEPTADSSQTDSLATYKALQSQQERLANHRGIDLPAVEPQQGLVNRRGIDMPVAKPPSMRRLLGQPQPQAIRSAPQRPHSFRKAHSSDWKKIQKPARVGRRNSCSTLYVGSTLSAPDKDATIKCVCGVFRAHILQSEMEGDVDSGDEYRIFNDLESQRKPGSHNHHRRRRGRQKPPTLDEVTRFYRDVFRRAQMETDCIIVSLIYVERLIKITDGALRPRACNWRSMLFSCMVLASKVWDDLSMWNADFSQTCPSGVRFTVRRVNELEVAVLSALDYRVKVLASEYAKYFFLLRSMLIKSGLAGDEMSTMNPLDVEGAKKLQLVSSQFQLNASSSYDPAEAAYEAAKGRQSKSMAPRNTGAQYRSVSEGVTPAETRFKVALEHVVKM